jgi:hypothetical protein
MVRNLNPGRINPLGGEKREEWKRLGDLALAALIVSPERALEIQTKLYPEAEMRGRPGVLCAYVPKRGTRANKRIPEADEDRKAPAEVSSEPSWRRTTEFFGAEEELEREEIPIAVAEEEFVAAD